jgi:hypothetical protein
LVLKQLTVRLLTIETKEYVRRTHLVDVFFPPDELVQRPLGEHAELGCDEADLARAPPHDRRRPAEGDELVELLPRRRKVAVRLIKLIKPQKRTSNERWKHFSTNTSSSKESGIWSAMSDGRKIASARTTRRMSFFSNLGGGNEM